MVNQAEVLRAAAKPDAGAGEKDASGMRPNGDAGSGGQGGAVK
jgi:hypothetical protein